MPRRDAVEEAVSRPGCSAAALADDESRRRIADDIDPWRRWQITATQVDLVLTLGVEATQSVKALQTSAGIGCVRMNGHRAQRHDVAVHDLELGRIPVLHSRELEEVPESEPIAVDLHSRHRLEKRDILWLEQVRAADEDAARPVEESRFARSHRRRQQLVAQLLHVTERMQVEDDEVAGDSLESPVVVRSQQLPHTRHPDLTVDRRQQNRPVAGDAERP